MTFHLIHHDDHAMIGTDRPIVKAGDAQGLQEASQLLARIRTLHADASTLCEEAERKAREDGQLHGEAQGRADFAAAIADIALQAREDRLAQEQQIADLALAALRRMVDEIGDEAMLVGAARRAVASVLPAEEVQVHVAPDLAQAVASALAGDERTTGVILRPSPELLAHQCRVVTSAGRVIADIDRQIAAIEDRWSAAHVD
ncbi:FliH/SctL family protein [Novosphingobium sp.]|jgi:flagellar biosynthesis/type III secretory pathway protein FliH|uniref:FliH/SctL family protein n=1 Tax=Novosphingobium sp. TaxID=1874826 RepID=UPI002FE07489